MLGKLERGDSGSRDQVIVDDGGGIFIEGQTSIPCRCQVFRRVARVFPQGYRLQAISARMELELRVVYAGSRITDFPVRKAVKNIQMDRFQFRSLYPSFASALTTGYTFSGILLPPREHV